MLGHMMVTASKVAKQLNLTQGYQIITNNGKDAPKYFSKPKNCGKHGHQTIYNLYLDIIGGE